MSGRVREKYAWRGLMRSVTEIRRRADRRLNAADSSSLSVLFASIPATWAAQKAIKSTQEFRNDLVFSSREESASLTFSLHT